MDTRWQDFAATDTIKDPALMPRYTAISRVAKAGRESEGPCGAVWNCLREGSLGTLVRGNVPKRVSSETPELDALRSWTGTYWR